MLSSDGDSLGDNSQVIREVDLDNDTDDEFELLIEETQSNIEDEIFLAENEHLLREWGRFIFNCPG